MELNHHHSYNNDCTPFLAPQLHHHMRNDFTHITEPQMPSYSQGFNLLPSLGSYEQEMGQIKDIMDSTNGLVQVKDEPFDMKPSYPAEEGSIVINSKNIFKSNYSNNFKIKYK